MKPKDDILDDVALNPPDFAGQYGEGTSGEKIALKTWQLACSVIKTRLKENEPSEVDENFEPPKPRDEGSD